MTNAEIEKLLSTAEKAKATIQEHLYVYRYNRGGSDYQCNFCREEHPDNGAKDCIHDKACEGIALIAQMDEMISTLEKEVQ